MLVLKSHLQSLQLEVNLKVNSPIKSTMFKTLAALGAHYENIPKS